MPASLPSSAIRAVVAGVIAWPYATFSFAIIRVMMSFRHVDRWCDYQRSDRANIGWVRIAAEGVCCIAAMRPWHDSWHITLFFCITSPAVQSRRWPDAGGSALAEEPS